VRPLGEIIVPAFTFPATAHAPVDWAHPVFCDIDPATHNIDPAAAAALITKRTTGIVGVHVGGGRATFARSSRSPRGTG
jgi:dTDP-4-amino-4,6-dideoxygalactose transaminase